ncbi:MAG: fluoride efflux transporter CrcB [Caulobacteraceae bacterium]|nr:fluoride efflux transporter CrcB [Caulobacteraceae bacterium]
MGNVLLVALGGGIGAAARYGVGVWAVRTFGHVWPVGTLTANVLGGALMGLLVGFLAHRGGEEQETLRLLLGVGALGGFTTFSAFSLETVLMIQQRDWGQAAAYVTASVGLSVAALMAGVLLARRLFA